MSSKPIIEFTFQEGRAENQDGSWPGEVNNCNPIPVSISSMPSWESLHQALEFNGPESVITIPVAEPLANVDRFTFEAVIRPRDKSRARMNLIEGQKIPFALTLESSEDNLWLSCSVHADKKWRGLTAKLRSIALNRWTSIAVVFTGNDLVFFINDRLTARRVLAGRELQPVGDKGLFVGTWPDGSRFQYIGDIAGLRVWDDIPPRLMELVSEAETSGLGEIESKYLDLGGSRSFLGLPTSADIRSRGGRRQAFANGKIYWHPATGAHEVHGEILKRYLKLGGPSRFLGWPLTDEENGKRRGSRVSRFQHGAIYWSGATKAHEVHGLIFVRYLKLEAEGGLLGLPVTDELAVPGGRKSLFEKGVIFWSPGTDAFEVHGDILKRYESLKGPKGFLGFPISNESMLLDSRGRDNGGRMSRFESGTIYWKAGVGAHEVHGDIRELYEEIGGPRSDLGYPTSNETRYPGTDIRYNDFQNGIIAWKPGVGAKAIPKLVLHLGKVISSSIDDGYKFFGKDKSAELVTYTTVKVNNRTLVGRKRSPQDHAGTSHDLNMRFDNIGPIRHDTKISLTIEVKDWDSTSKKDYLGTLEKQFDITSFWGLLGGRPAGLYSDVPADKKGSDLPHYSSLRFNYTIAVHKALDMSKHFREQCWWRSDNFDTGTLTRQQFADTFRDVENAPETWDKIINPFDTMFYELAYKSVASSGNCVGMSLEGIYSRVGRSQFIEPLHEWKMNGADNADNGPPAGSSAQTVYNSVRKVINDKHAYQLGASAIRWYLNRITSLEAINPLEVYGRVKHELWRRNFPVLCMVDIGAGKGHCVWPYRWKDGTGSRSNPHILYVADPNNVWREHAGDPTRIEIFSDNIFQFVEPDNIRYRSSRIAVGLLPGTLMLEIPFNKLSSQPHTPFFEILAALSLLIGGLLLLAGDAESTQITGDGHKFYRARSKGRLGVIANGIPGMARVPFLDAPAKVPELYAQRGELPNVLEQEIKGVANGKFSQLLATRHNVISYESPIAANALDKLNAESLRTPKPLLSLETSQAAKTATIDYSVILDRRRKDLRQYSLDLQLSKKGVARVGVQPRGNSLIISPAGNDQPFNITMASVINGDIKKSTITVRPDSGAVLQIRPRDWSSLQGDTIVESLSSIGGGILSRIVMKGK